MRLSQRLTRGRKAWSEPPFWSLDRLPMLGSAGVLADREKIGNDYEGYVRGAYKSNGIVFACILARQLVFSEARFQWQRMSTGRPGDLFGTPDLALLETPWPNGTTGELLAWMEADVSLAGNFYATITDDAGHFGKSATGPGRRITRMRPDWVTIVLNSQSGDPYALDTKIVAYVYEPPVTAGLRSEPVTLLADEVCHYSPIPDPEARFRGMSWLTPVLREIEADKATTHHKKRFFENGATPQVIVSLDTDDDDTFQQFVEMFRRNHRGPDKAGETLFLANGADAKVVGADLKQLDFKNTQGAGETRIAAAASVPPVIAGFSEGLQAATYSNYGQARRRFADGTIYPLWRSAVGSLQTLLPPPDGARLWFDPSDVAFLREDRRDVAEIQQAQAMTIRQLVDAGFDAASVAAAVKAEDFGLLTHTGLFSVQLQPPGSGQTTNEPGQEAT
ncbi:Phage portal protein BeeE [Saccharopolyspora shandongensis]|uniref:Phage portal protein BeeE n=1 Tax=Saccharopolyspora shandongensis TaxID=418495 RepID=A0A1H3TYX9_9PSEU|nr:phage portal protein [Saccharopolyspora shandongensis]SDZ55247.1 Phage portal protein BeeE [Saccharopolyspora shandongensis]